MTILTHLPPTRVRTVADLMRDLGGIPLERVRLVPPPGMATINDVEGAKGCELIEGTLVEKAMGWHESILAVYLAGLLNAIVEPQNLGIVSGEEGGLELLTGLIRKPDVAFISWDRFPGRRLPDEAWPAVAPDLAVEVISRGNTAEEMKRKRGEYFQAGVQLIWEIDRFTRTATVYTSPTHFQQLTEADTLDGGTVLPGFSVAVRDIFARLDRHG